MAKYSHPFKVPPEIMDNSQFQISNEGISVDSHQRPPFPNEMMGSLYPDGNPCEGEKIGETMRTVVPYMVSHKAWEESLTKCFVQYGHIMRLSGSTPRFEDVQIAEKEGAALFDVFLRLLAQRPEIGPARRMVPQNEGGESNG